MQPGQWSEVRRLFEELAELPEEERTRRLIACAVEDPEIERAVVKLLESDARVESDAFLQEPALAGFDANVPALGEDPAGAVVGGFRIVRLLAAGGMGEVYLAEQAQPARTVALKVLKPALATSPALHRFEVESDVLARLRDPGIAQVFAAGVHEVQSGPFRWKLPWYAMEWLEGADTILGFVESRQVSLRERLRLFLEVCRAIEQAHHRGVIHRDLKPANILVTADGVPKVIDFGVALVQDDGERVATTVTNPGEIVGTLAYMAPEQVDPRRGHADARSDVYALGIVLHELLAGEKPFVLEGGSITDLIEVMRTQGPRSLPRTFGRDLGWIVSRSLEKDPNRRYQSVTDLARDLERYLAGESVEAAPPHALYRFRKLVLRHKAFFMSLAAIFLSLLGGLIANHFALGRAKAAESAERLARIEEEDRRNTAQKAQRDAEREDARTSEAMRALAEAIRMTHLENGGTDLRLVDVFDRLHAIVRRGTIIDAEVTGILATYLTDLYVTCGSYDRAEAILRAARERIGEAGFLQSGNGAILIGNLAEVLRLLGRPNEAEPVLEEAFDIASMYAPEAWEVMASLHHKRAMLRLAQSRSPDAAEDARWAHEMRRKRLGEDHLETVDSLGVLAVTILQQGRFDEAEPILRELVEVQARAHGEASPKTITTRANLAMCLVRKGSLEEAHAELSRAMTQARASLPDTHPLRFQILANHAFVLGRLRKHAEAFEVWEELLERQRETLGTFHTETLNAEANFAMNLIALSRADEAVTLIAPLLEDSSGRPDVGNRVLVNLIYALINAHLALGHPGDAEASLRRSEEFGRAYSPEDRKVLEELAARVAAAREGR